MTLYLTLIKLTCDTGDTVVNSHCVFISNVIAILTRGEPHNAAMWEEINKKQISGGEMRRPVHWQRNPIFI